MSDPNRNERRSAAVAKITETRLRKGDPRLKGILVGSVPPYFLEKIRAQRTKDVARDPVAERASEIEIPVDPECPPRS
jgi:hypothetical protein